MTKYFCDSCKKEFTPQDGIGEIKGFIPKMNEKLEKQNYNFVGNYCPACSELLLNFISTLTDELGNTNRPIKQADKK